MAAFGDTLIRTFQTLCCVLLAAAIVFLSALTWTALTVRHAARQAERDELQLAPRIARAIGSVESIEYNTTRTEAEMAGLLNAERHAVTNEKQVLDAATRSLNTLNAMEVSLNDAAVSLNGVIVSAKDPIVSANKAIVSAQADIHQAMGSANDALTAAAAQISNPAIGQSIADIRDSAESTKTSMANLAAITDDGHKVADHYTAQILKPVSKARAALNVASEAIGHFVHDVLF